MVAPREGGAYAPVNGLEMYYEVHGKASPGGTPLVLLHGGGSTIETSFGKVLAAYARRRQVIAFEQQGHGRTGDVDRPFSFRQSSEDAVALLGHLGIGRADLLGYSNGGHIAFQAALDHPEAVRKLILMSAMLDRSGSDPQFWESFKTAKLEEVPPLLQQAYLAAAPHPDLPSFFAKSVRRMVDFQGWTEDEIRSVRAPTLVLCGDSDVVLPEHAVRIYRLLPNAQLAIVPGADHMSLVERADVLPALVEAFLRPAAEDPGRAPR